MLPKSVNRLFHMGKRPRANGRKFLLSDVGIGNRRSNLTLD